MGREVLLSEGDGDRWTVIPLESNVVCQMPAVMPPPTTLGSQSLLWRLHSPRRTKVLLAGGYEVKKVYLPQMDREGAYAA